MYFEPDAGDKAAETLMYIQAVYDVVSSRYPCNEEDCLTLAALQLQYEYSDDGLETLDVRYPAAPRWLSFTWHPGAGLCAS